MLVFLRPRCDIAQLYRMSLELKSILHIQNVPGTEVDTSHTECPWNWVDTLHRECPWNWSRYFTCVQQRSLHVEYKQ